MVARTSITGGARKVGYRSGLRFGLGILLLAGLLSPLGALAGEDTRAISSETRQPEAPGSAAEEQAVSDAAFQAGPAVPEQGTDDYSEAAYLADDSFSLRLFNAELVARVKVTGIHRIIDKALSEPGMVALLGYVYSGITQKVWKGDPAKLIAFRLTLNDCDRKLKRGEQYLIFAQSDMLGRLKLTGCEAVVSESEAGALLVKLDQYYQG
ncbi:hypothetical protein PVT68_01110 [Microbulbifer bruguierae]|uniref:Uncharacterized protein n=1 Tax=Microbulbifer bruguierae TaxID=3029061 RepID=A0ABY8NDC6_9GAMM|nr:hypothetical protein [Microbulbifer bruguierae]WGL16913.1 hypothetical protein PVT68_01110 [Microbulbifer bruguierae]